MPGGAGVKRRVSVYEGMFHVFQMSMDLVPESRKPGTRWPGLCRLYTRLTGGLRDRLLRR